MNGYQNMVIFSLKPDENANTWLVPMIGKVGPYPHEKGLRSNRNIQGNIKAFRNDIIDQ